MKLFWGDEMSGWRVWGLWFGKKYFVGFSVVNNEKEK